MVLVGCISMQLTKYSWFPLSNYNIHVVLSREWPWRHWACPRIHAARRILYASIPAVVPFWTREKTHKFSRAMTSVFLQNTRWHHGRSRGETKYSMITILEYLQVSVCISFLLSVLLLQTSTGHPIWIKTMADRRSSLKDWTAVLSLLVSISYYYIAYTSLIWLKGILWDRRWSTPSLYARHALECVYLQKSENRKKGGGQNISDIKGVVV